MQPARILEQGPSRGILPSARRSALLGEDPFSARRYPYESVGKEAQDDPTVGQEVPIVARTLGKVRILG